MLSGAAGAGDGAGAPDPGAGAVGAPGGGGLVVVVVVDGTSLHGWLTSDPQPVVPPAGGGVAWTGWLVAVLP